MMRTAAVLALALVGFGCSGSPTPPVRTPAEAQFFKPASMHLSSAFTKVTDFDGDGAPDGVEAVVELQDRFGDATKAAGRIVFQVYAYKPVNPDTRGIPIAGPFEGRVDSIQDQRNRWSRVNRAYIFQLAFPNAALDHDYVVDAMFESTDGKRLFDRMTIEGDHVKPNPTTGPSPIYTPIVPSTAPTTATAATGPAGAPASGSIVTQESLRVPNASQPHEPPPRADQP